MTRAKAEALTICMNFYANDLFRAFKYLCDLYKEEPGQEITLKSFLSNIKAITRPTLKRGTRSTDEVFCTTDPVTALNTYVCKACNKTSPNIGLMNALKKRTAHTDHITEDDFFITCTHCPNKIPFYNLFFKNHSNIALMRVVYRFSSLINLMHSCVDCKDCLAVVTKFYTAHHNSIDLHEARMLKLMSFDAEFFTNAQYLFSDKVHRLIAQKDFVKVDFPDEETRKRARVL